VKNVPARESELANYAGATRHKDAGALPLLSYLLDDMWKRMVEKGDGILRLPAKSIDIGRVLVHRANAFLRCHPGAENDLRRIFTLKLATVREGGEPTRRRAFRSEFSDEEWRLVTELANHPNRLLTTGTRVNGATPLSPTSGPTDAEVVEEPTHPADAKAIEKAKGLAITETYAEVAHEAIFRRWDKLQQWIDVEREFLAWRSSLEAARHTWETAATEQKNGALLLGLSLAKAQSWRAKRGVDLPLRDTEFIDLSIQRDQKVQRRQRYMSAAVLALGIVIVSVLGYSTRDSLYLDSQLLADLLQPKVLAATTEGILEPKQTFKECSYCPEMVVVPPGQFEMGSTEDEKDADKSELPRHTVTIDYRFAVSRYQITFDEWDVCYELKGCTYLPGDQDWGRGRRPIINVSWDHAQQYVKWLSKETGRSYSLLSEAEYEYAARAGTQTAYAWGDEIGSGNANCEGCKSRWDNKSTAPVGFFPPNAFGLYDMVGNVHSWVDDCWHETYEGTPPTDGSSWTTGCYATWRALRGGSFTVSSNSASALRSAARRGYSKQFTVVYVGFRIKRAL
jgi:formylglycine-generating enzyme required for sulfatase activity